MFGKIRLLPLVAVLILAAMPASAGRVRDSVLSQLKQQGYAEITETQTWLGRTRIVARRDGERREIIINPRTGEILRDFWETEDEANPVILIDPSLASPGEDGDSGDGGGNGGENGGGGGGHGTSGDN